MYREGLYGAYQKSGIGEPHNSLRPGFERQLLKTLESLTVSNRLPSHMRVVARIQIETAQRDEPVWTTGYQEHIELKKGESVLGGSYVSILALDNETGTEHPICEPGLEVLYGEFKRSRDELGSFILQGLIWPALDRHRLRIADQIAEHEDKIAELRALRALYVSLRGER